MRGTGDKVLAVWLILIGLSPFLRIPIDDTIESLLALVAGVLLLIGR